MNRRHVQWLRPASILRGCACLLTLAFVAAPGVRQTAAADTAVSTPPPGDRHQDATISFPDGLLVQNGGPVLDVTRPPEPGMRAARGDGRTDDTAALRDAYDFLLRAFKAHGPWGPQNNYYVYLPNGDYKVSDTLIYRGPTVGAFPKWDGKFDINHIHLVGQSRARTVIRLIDHCPGYDDPAHPKIVVATQHPDTIFNNVPGGNWIRNLTIDTGRGNPGAVALFLQGANNTDLRSVTLRSEDGAGRYGIWCKQGSIQGYYCDVTIDGFDDGICDTVNAEGDIALEYLTLRNQREAGIRLEGGGLSLRKVLSDQSKTGGAPALRLDGSGPQAVVLESLLRGGKSGNPAIELTRDKEQCLFARDVATIGYGAAVRRAGQPVETTPNIAEYASLPAPTPTSIAPAQTPTPPRSLHLAIEDTPRAKSYDPKTQWAIVDDYPSLQAAMDSGKPVVVFKRREYKLTGDVTVPASVKVINGMASGASGGALVVAQACADPLFVEDATLPIRVGARRDIVQRCASGGLANPQGLPVTFYLENVNDDATGNDFCRTGQRVFARQIDIEYGQGEQIVANGGALWIFGFKTENMGATPFTVRHGGTLEILGGYCNTVNAPPPDRQHPLLHNEGGRVSATLFTNLGSPFLKTVVTTRSGIDAVVPNTDFPLRGAVYRRDFAIPLYVGYVEPVNRGEEH